MPVYSYIGLDARGKERKGTLEADGRKDAVRILRERSIYMLKMKEGYGADLEDGFLKKLDLLFSFMKPSRYLPVGTKDLVIFFRQIALMLRAGFTLVSALEACHDLQTKHRLRKIIHKMSEDIRRGAAFSASLSKEKKLFPSMITNLIESGERSGNIERILERLADNMERSKEVKLQMFSAMFYPVLVLTMTFFIVGLLVVYVIPRFSAFLNARNAEIPRSTQFLVDVSDWGLTWGGPIAVWVSIISFFILAAYTTKQGKLIIDGIILKIPIIGESVRCAAMAQAGWSLSMLLKSGMTALESLRITSGTIGNLAIGKCFEYAAENLLDGRPLSKTFEQPQIPLMMRHMASVGENSGQLDTVMNDVGEYYQKELLAKIKIMAIMVEPVMIIVAGLLVLFVYYSIFQVVMAVSKGGM